jgi:L-fucose mutarotase
MLKYRLIHPPLLGALARCGHGSRILIADANYPHLTGAPAAAERIYLNLAPGLLTVSQVLALVLEAIPVESAIVTLNETLQEPPVVAEYRQMLPAGVAVQALARFDYYEAVKSPDTCLVIATGEQKLYANVLLVVGVMTPEGAAKY